MELKNFKDILFKKALSEGLKSVKYIIIQEKI